VSNVCDYLEFLKGGYTCLLLKLQLLFSVRSIRVCRCTNKAVSVNSRDL
jgi:hypothetical protein